MMQAGLMDAKLSSGEEGTLQLD